MPRGLAAGLLVFGVAMLLPGVILLVRPRAVAKWNDSVHPLWLRNFNRAPGQTTKAWQMIVGGAALIGAGALTVLVALAAFGFNPLHMS